MSFLKNPLNKIDFSPRTTFSKQVLRKILINREIRMEKEIKILVVEDEPEILLMTCRILKSAGYEVLRASTGNEALQIVQQAHPDLVLLDVHLPDINGIEVCQQIKQDITLDSYVVILSNSRKESRHQIEGLNAGADGYIVRPISNQELLARIQSIIRLKQVEKQLREREQQFAQFMEAVPIGIFVLDAKGQPYYANRMSQNILGKGITESTTPDKLAEVYRAYTSGTNEPYPTEKMPLVKALSGESTTVQDMEIHQPDKIIPLEVQGSPIFNENGEITYAIAAFQDMTERERAEKKRLQLEEELRHAQKMDALGTLAGGIAHDFNNLLVPILGYTQAALAKMDPKNKEFHHLEKVVQSAQKAKNLVSQIFTFGRKMELTKESIHIKTLIKDVLKLLKSTIPVTISIEYVKNSNLPLVYVSPSQIHQVLMNLCINASQAMPGGGKLTIKSEYVKNYQFINSTSQKIEGNFVCLHVQDTGIGIGKTTLEHIFEPFFTTKKREEGTGLGLSVVLGIVQQHGGNIEVISKEGKGTTFKVYLPISETKMERSEEKPPKSIILGEGHVLLIDDETMVNDTGTLLLEDLGYRVTSFDDAKKALVFFAEQSQDFDLIITDYAMPHMNGVQLAEKIKEIREDIPILLCTGYNDVVSKESIDQWGIDDLVMKPYEFEELSETVWQILNKDNAN